MRRASFRPGDRLGSYQLCELIGAGGMSRVFLATVDGRIGRRRYVAVKCMRDEHSADPDYSEMFRDEIRIATQIDHPNVYSVFDRGVVGSVPYLVMEHLVGRTFSQIRKRLADQPELLPAGRRTPIVARLMAEACHGIEAIHQARDLCGRPLAAVHRDVCPANLFVTIDGGVVVLDLGVARSAGQRHRTQPGVVKGKYSYLAPELLDGSPPDRQADIWALGAVAHEMLTGRRLFGGVNELEVIRAIGRGDPITPPSVAAPGVSELADEIVMCALERDPGDRFSDARELGELFAQLSIETGPVVGPGEVAEVVAAMFPDLAEDTRRLYDRAEAIDVPLIAIDDLEAVEAVEVSEPSDLSVEIEVIRPPACTPREPPAVAPARVSSIAARTALAIAVLWLGFLNLTCVGP